MALLEACECAATSSTSTAPSPSPTTSQPQTTESVTTQAPVTTESVTTQAPVTTEAETKSETESETDSVIDSTVRRAQASVFGDYTQINWSNVICTQEGTDAKPYMQGNPICAAAINMGKGNYAVKDQNDKPGFCLR